jgi:hypothetical protein
MNWGRLWQEVARVESAAWATNCMHYLCDAKRFFLLGAYIDYHVGELDYADAELDCTDYYPGPRKTKRCLDRDNAQANRLHLAQQVIKAADDLLHCLSRKKCACRSGQ